MEVMNDLPENHRLLDKGTESLCLNFRPLFFHWQKI